MRQLGALIVLLGLGGAAVGTVGDDADPGTTSLIYGSFDQYRVVGCSVEATFAPAACRVAFNASQDPIGPSSLPGPTGIPAATLAAALGVRGFHLDFHGQAAAGGAWSLKWTTHRQGSPQVFVDYHWECSGFGADLVDHLPTGVVPSNPPCDRLAYNGFTTGPDLWQQLEVALQELPTCAPPPCTLHGALLFES